MSSWLNDLAGRAENLLNNIDQSAADLIEKKDKPSNIKQNFSNEINTTKSNFQSNNTPLSITSLPVPTKKISLKKKKTTEDEDLFKFLNEDSKINQNDSKLISRKGKLNEVPQNNKINRTDFVSTPVVNNQKDNHPSTLNKNEDSRLSVENSALKEEIAYLQKSILETRDRNTNKLKKLHAENKSLTVSNSEAISRIKNLQNENFELREYKQASLNAVTESGLQNTNNDLKERTEELEKKILELKSDLKKAQLTNSEITDINKTLQKKLSEVEKQLEFSNEEMVAYKNKAARILQSKERLISSLKNNPTEDLNNSAMLAEQKENDEIVSNLLKENYMMKDEIRDLHNELKELDDKTAEKIKELKDEKDSLNEKYLLSKQYEEEQRQELNRMSDEKFHLNEDFSNFRRKHDEKINEKDTEIQRLNNQLSMKINFSPNEQELESRIRVLTEDILVKQHTINNLHCEKSSLQLQLERMQGQIQRLSNEPLRNQYSPYVDSKSNYFMKKQPTFKRKNFKNTFLNFVDQISIHIGNFLRRVPIARIFFFFYMMLLHIWTCMIIFTYSPETHDDVFFKELKQGSKHLED